MAESDPGGTSQEGLTDKIFWDNFYHYVDALKEGGITLDQESLLNMPDRGRKEEAVRLLGHAIFDNKPPKEASITIGEAIRFLDQYGFFQKGDDSDAFEDESS